MVLGSRTPYFVCILRYLVKSIIKLIVCKGADVKQTENEKDFISHIVAVRFLCHCAAKELNQNSYDFSAKNHNRKGADGCPKG